MLDLPLPDWMQKALLVGTYDDEPILVQIDGYGQFSGGLGAYIDRYVYNKYETSVGVDLNHDTAPVPAGEKFIITNISFWHDDSIPRRLTIYFQETTLSHVMCNAPFLLQYEVLDRQGLWVLKEGDFIRAVLVTPAVGQHGSLTVSGYKVEDLT